MHKAGERDALEAVAAWLVRVAKPSRSSAAGALLALCAAVSGCAQAHGRIEGGPLYVHLCDAMPEDDQLAWGEAAGEINAELGEPLLWVGHGPPIGCNTVDVCPSSVVGEGAETRVGECVITVRYMPGIACEVAVGELRKALHQQ